MADPALQPATPEARKQAETIAPHEEAFLKEGEKMDAESRKQESIGEKEERLAEEGMARVNELGKNLDLQAEAGAKEFKEETKSVWSRMKERLFKKKDGGPVKGEAEILAEIEKADAVFANFRKEMARIMAHGGEAELRALEGSLSAAYDQLAPKVAAEGAEESAAMKKALKTGEMPQVTETGAKLNYINKRLADVREKLAGGKFGSTEALAAANAAAQEQAAAEAPAPTAEAPQEAPAPKAEAPEAKPSPEARLAADREFLLKGGKLKDGTVVKGAEGLPGERMIDDYLKVRDLDADSYGEIVGKSFDPVKGEIRLTYEDGGQLRSYASGMKLRVHPGGKVEEINARKERIAEMGARVDAAMAAEDAAAKEEGGEENPIQLTPEMRTAPAEETVFTDAEKAELAKDAQEALRGQLPASGEIEAKEASAPAAEAEPSVVLAPEVQPMKIVRSSETPVASGEIENETVLQKTKTSEDAPTAAGEIEVEDAQIISEAPAVEAAPPAPEAISVEPGDDLRMTPAAKPEAAPAEELTPEKIAKAKKEPLAPASLPAIVETLRTKGKAGDGKFATPASFLQALETAGFEMPSDMEADDPKKLHEAYKKALKAKK